MGLVIGLDFGSSPLARGTLLNAAPVNGDPRLIPARAGNTYGERVAGTPESAHPRSRGEHFITTQIRIDFVGSSPLARGTRGMA